MALYHIYRPKRFADLIGQDHIRTTLLNALKTDKVGHAYLFAGPRGLGKTTTARLLAKAINCEQLKNGELCGDLCQACKSISSGQTLDIIEIDAASNRGIDEIRELRELVKFAPSILKKKAIIIDEVHMLTKEAFNALLKTLEEPPAHIVFILATTEAHKVQPTILSRVQRFDFKRPSEEILAEHITSIGKKEGFSVEPDAARLLANLSDGAFRDSVSLLDQVTTIGKKTITKEVVEQLLGLSNNQTIAEFLDAISNNNRKAALACIDTFLQNGGDMTHFITQTIGEIRRLMRIQNDERYIGWLKDLLVALDQVKHSPITALPLELFIATHTAITSTATEAQPLDTIRKVEEKNQPVKDVVDSITIEPIKLKPLDNPESKELWSELIKQMKQRNASIATVLNDSILLSLSDDGIRIGVKFKFHKDKISDRKNLDQIESLLEELSGKRLSLHCDVRQEIPIQKQEDDLVMEALNVFQG